MSYHMYGEHIGSLSVITSSRGTAAAWRVISGDQGNQWLTAMIDITLVRNDRVSLYLTRSEIAASKSNTAKPRTRNASLNIPPLYMKTDDFYRFNAISKVIDSQKRGFNVVVTSSVMGYMYELLQTAVTDWVFGSSGR